MLIYYILVSGPIIYGFYDAKRKTRKQGAFLFLAVSAFALTLIAGFRYAIGFDYFSYRSLYELFVQLPFPQVYALFKGELLFAVYCKILSFFQVPYTGFLLLTSFFLHGTAMWFIKRYSKIPWLSVYLFLTLQFFAYNMNLVRQAMAVSCFLLAYPFLVKRRLLPYLMIILCGSLIHLSILITIPLFFLLPLKVTKTSLGILSVLTLIFYVICDPLVALIAPLLPPKYSCYNTSIFWLPSTPDYVLFPLMYFLLILFLRKRFPAQGMLSSIYLNSAFYTLAFTAFITRHFILERFAIYPFILSILAIPELVYGQHAKDDFQQPPGSARQMKNGSILILFLCFGASYFLFAAYKGFHHVYPYFSLWDKASSSFQ